MTILSCMIIESRERSSSMLEEFITRIPYLKLSHKIKGEESITPAIMHQPVNLVFYDMEMINEKVIHLLKQANPLVLIIGIVPLQEYEVKNMELDIFSFLHRPLSFERFFSIIMMARKYLLLARSFSGGVERNFIFIKSEYKIIKVKFDEILFCEGMKDYTQIYLKGKSTPILTLQNLKSFYSKLPVTDFVRVHRSYVVSLAGIDTIARNEISIGKKIIPIGESFREGFFHIVQDHS